MTRRFVLALTAAALLAASVLAQPAARARTTAQAGAAGRGAFWPRQVYAPYFETWTSASIPAVAVKSAARFFSLAFLQTAKKGSCALTWNGTKSEPVAGPRYRAQIAALYSWSSQRHLWAMEGITILPGIDDYPGKTEITYLSDTRRILGFARAHGLGLLSIWAIQRGQRRLPGHHRQRFLLRHQAARLGLQPPARAVHALAQVRRPVEVEDGPAGPLGLRGG